MFAATIGNCNERTQPIFAQPRACGLTRFVGAMCLDDLREGGFTDEERGGVEDHNTAGFLKVSKPAHSKRPFRSNVDYRDM
eukprot:COSAG05_NODE_2467_length_3028_cov_4.291909_2_plen_81_part_00